jgi:hypothetical protein
VWALGSAGAIKAFAHIKGITHLTIFADNDANGIGDAVADECARRWADAGTEVTVRTPRNPHGDWLEALYARL